MNITWGENWCFLEQRVLRYARMRPRGSRHKNCLHVLPALNKGHNHTGRYSNSGHRHRCTWIMIGLFNKLLPLHLSANVWISLAMGKRFQLISVNLICASLCRNTSREMPLFHSFTGCDTISCFTARATERNPLGKLGSRIVRLQMCSLILLIRTHFTSRTRRTATSSCLTVLLWFFMTRQAMKPLWMKQEKKCSSRRTGHWRICHPHR